MPGKTEYTVEQAAEILHHVYSHMLEGGSFRFLIYDRLGFGPEGYVPLYEIGGMEITNACPVNMSPDIPPHIAHVGAGSVTWVRDDGQEVMVEIGDEKKRCDVMRGTFSVGDPAIFIYFACESSGTFKALPIGEIFAAHELEPLPSKDS